MTTINKIINQTTKMEEIKIKKRHTSLDIREWVKNNNHWPTIMQIRDGIASESSFVDLAMPF